MTDGLVIGAAWLEFLALVSVLIATVLRHRNVAKATLAGKSKSKRSSRN